jgi:hypothetical protein
MSQALCRRVQVQQKGSEVEVFEKCLIGFPHPKVDREYGIFSVE